VSRLLVVVVGGCCCWLWWWRTACQDRYRERVRSHTRSGDDDDDFRNDSRFIKCHRLRPKERAAAPPSPLAPSVNRVDAPGRSDSS